MSNRIFVAFVISAWIAGHLMIGQTVPAQPHPLTVSEQPHPLTVSEQSLQEVDFNYKLLLEVRVLKTDIARMSNAIELIWLKLEIQALEDEIKHIDRLEAKEVYSPKSHWDQQRKVIHEKIAAYCEQMTQYQKNHEQKTVPKQTSGLKEETGTVDENDR